ncbi:MAG: hypothetical protein HQL96_05085 [Magnetococcales bacterium]|nr:hypothetical protein [Magnetococcales bacterium]
MMKRCDDHGSFLARLDKLLPNRYKRKERSPARPAIKPQAQEPTFYAEEDGIEFHDREPSIFAEPPGMRFVGAGVILSPSLESSSGRI